MNHIITTAKIIGLTLSAIGFILSCYLYYKYIWKMTPEEFWSTYTVYGSDKLSEKAKNNKRNPYLRSLVYFFIILAILVCYLLVIRFNFNF